MLKTKIWDRNPALKHATWSTTVLPSRRRPECRVFQLTRSASHKKWDGHFLNWGWEQHRCLPPRLRDDMAMLDAIALDSSLILHLTLISHTSCRDLHKQTLSNRPSALHSGHGLYIYIYIYTTECRYNAIQYNIILFITSNTAETEAEYKCVETHKVHPISRPNNYGVYFVRIFEKIDRVKATLHCIYIYIIYIYIERIPFESSFHIISSQNDINWWFTWISRSMSFEMHHVSYDMAYYSYYHITKQIWGIW